MEKVRKPRAREERIEKRDMEAKSIVENGESSKNCSVGFAGDVAEADEKILKRRIAIHPLVGLLIDTHLNCLKVALGEPVEVLGTKHATNQAILYPAPTIPSSSSELDRFMEAYCVALSKLKEAMQASQQESKSFIDSKHVQLRELSKPGQNNSPKSNSRN